MSKIPSRAIEILQHREHLRQQLARPPVDLNDRLDSRSADVISDLQPEKAFYSVIKSAKYHVDNRYRNILAYDRTAIVVGDDGYLNANLVCDAQGGWWVASQAPLPRTMFYYFKAIYERSASKHPALIRKPIGTPKSKSVITVQLTGLKDGSVAKADPYIPEPGKEIMFTPKHVKPSSNSAPSPGHEEPEPGMNLRTLSSRHVDKIGSRYTELTLSPANSTDSMVVHHYLFEGWPDHGVPSGKGRRYLRELISTVGKQREELGGVDECEVWVHCSAGVGRTGTFIALSSLLLPSPAPSSTPLSSLPVSPIGPLPAELATDKVAVTIDAMREWRGQLCQTREQVALVYRLKQHNTDKSE